MKMKVTVSRKELADALKVAIKATAAKSATPILSGIYFKAAESSLELQATDNWTRIVTKIAANVESGGEIVLVGKYILEIILKLQGETVTITTAETQATITSAGTKYTLLILDAEEFPKIKPTEESLSGFILRQAELKKLIRQTAFAAAKEGDGRPIFEGVLLRLKSGTMAMVATNTHRMAVNYATVPFEDECDFIVPAKILQYVSGMLGEGEVNITFNKRTVNFVFDNLQVRTRIIDGMYPAFDKVIPKESTTIAIVNRQEFLQALERVSIIAKVTDYEIADLLFSEGEIKISATSADVGNAEETITAEIEGGDVDIAFNYDYLIEPVRILESEKVQIGLTEDLKPIEIKPLNDGETFRYVVTPVRRNYR